MPGRSACDRSPGPEIANLPRQRKNHGYLVDSLAKRGERGLEAVKRLTTHADPRRAKAARELVARIDAARNTPVSNAAQGPVADAAKPDPASQPKPPAKPTHGSLPKTLADALR